MSTVTVATRVNPRDEAMQAGIQELLQPQMEIRASFAPASAIEE
ncbi:MAG: hypothetical protein AAFN41_07900 [Planctomycetota bacterium]